MAAERVQKILAQAGFGSRRSCEDLIRTGRVTINGQKASLGVKADSQTDDIRVNGKPISLPDTFTYVILNKPVGVISDEDVKGKLQAARDLIPIEGHLFPVGRLDLRSQGLLLFTNDGKLAHKLTHPRFEHEKEYEVTVNGTPQRKHLEAWRRGIDLKGKRTLPAKVQVREQQGNTTVLSVVMREGRKRQIRQVASRLGHPVQKLVRRRIGPIEMGDLAEGQWRHLTKAEVEALQTFKKQKPKQKRRPASTKRQSKGG